jgi:hypothetical protein
MIGYVIGREFGYWLLLRYGEYLWITESRIKLGQYLFLRHGGKIIILAQFLPVLRSIAGILAVANLGVAFLLGGRLFATTYSNRGPRVGTSPIAACSARTKAGSATACRRSCP